MADKLAGLAEAQTKVGIQFNKKAESILPALKQTDDDAIYDDFDKALTGSEQLGKAAKAIKNVKSSFGEDSKN